MEDFEEKFMREAILLAEENVTKKIGGPFGAVIVKDGVLIAKSGNLVTQSNDPTAHAEVAAIRLACKKLNTFDLSGCIVYTSCEPCPMCLSALYWARVAKIYYGNSKYDAAAIGFDDQFIYDELELPQEKRKLKVHQIMRNEALNAFKLWEKDVNKIEY
ncbi:nucleoside deaminase [Pedobacter flavus]|uniref:Nucleoside deaminase n=1 Tax=Pedobacter flavus TaxID=3113906 RepID=A0ABU7H1N9_9SPHI|nr:nucleoside deaminase [Pedobacter sp. VNH31]MEE1885156.1 nucleoside deaminase [Pedobacter sp. VNH31]